MLILHLIWTQLCLPLPRRLHHFDTAVGQPIRKHVDDIYQRILFPVMLRVRFSRSRAGVRSQVCATRGPLDINKRSSSPLIQRVYSGAWIHACVNRRIAKMSRRSIAGELGLTWLRKLLQRHRLWSRNILKNFKRGLELLE